MLFLTVQLVLCQKFSIIYRSRWFYTQFLVTAFYRPFNYSTTEKPNTTVVIRRAKGKILYYSKQERGGQDSGALAQP